MPRPLAPAPRTAPETRPADSFPPIRSRSPGPASRAVRDILSLSGKNRERCELLLRAARTVDTTFKIMLMPDMSSLRTGDPKVLADALAELGRHPSAHRLDDGRLAVAPFKSEASIHWWSDMIDELRARHGIRTAFVPLFLDFGSHDGSFAAISHSFSGSRSYAGEGSGSRDARRAHGMGKIWMQPVSVQDARPNQDGYHEAGNTATLHATWARAIEGEADWVQLTTWNDYSEGTHFAPSLHNGHAYLDLTSYYLTAGPWTRSRSARRPVSTDAAPAASPACPRHEARSKRAVWVAWSSDPRRSVAVKNNACVSWAVPPMTGLVEGLDGGFSAGLDGVGAGRSRQSRAKQWMRPMGVKPLRSYQWRGQSDASAVRKRVVQPAFAALLKAVSRAADAWPRPRWGSAVTRSSICAVPDAGSR